MKFTNGAHGAIVPDNFNTAVAVIKTGVPNPYARALLLCLCDALDDIIAGRVTHLTLGLNMRKTSILLTANSDEGSKAYVDGVNYEELVWKWATTIGPEEAAAVLDAGVA